MKVDQDCFIIVADEETEGEGEESSGECPYHTVVLDCAPIAFTDSTGIAVLEQVYHTHYSFMGNTNNHEYSVSISIVVFSRSLL